MKSNKQRRAELALKRRKREAKRTRAASQDPRDIRVDAETTPCNPSLLAPDNSYGVPPFVARGYYIDQEFACVGCRSREIWRATQQKWWYEVAKGNVWTTALRCRSCRRAERERKLRARETHLAGIARKRATRI